MFGFLRKKPAKVNFPAPPRRGEDGLYHLTWVRKKMPDPGAENYALETLALKPLSIIGPSVAVRHPIVPLQRGSQPYVPFQSGPLQGIGQVSGVMQLQPLYNSSLDGAGYSGPSPLAMNEPFPRAEIQPAGRGVL